MWLGGWYEGHRRGEQPDLDAPGAGERARGALRARRAEELVPGLGEDARPARAGDDEVRRVVAGVPREPAAQGAHEGVVRVGRRVLVEAGALAEEGVRADEPERVEAMGGVEARRVGRGEEGDRRVVRDVRGDRRVGGREVAQAEVGAGAEEVAAGRDDGAVRDDEARLAVGRGDRPSGRAVAALHRDGGGRAVVDLHVLVLRAVVAAQAQLADREGGCRGGEEGEGGRGEERDAGGSGHGVTFAAPSPPVIRQEP